VFKILRKENFRSLILLVFYTCVTIGLLAFKKYQCRKLHWSDSLSCINRSI